MDTRVLHSEPGLSFKGDTQDGLEGYAYEATVTHAAYGLSSVELCESFEAFKCSGLHIVNALTTTLDGIVWIEGFVEFPGLGKLGLDGRTCVAFEYPHGSLSETCIGFDEGLALGQQELRGVVCASQIATVEVFDGVLLEQGRKGSCLCDA